MVDPLSQIRLLVFVDLDKVNIGMYGQRYDLNPGRKICTPIYWPLHHDRPISVDIIAYTPVIPTTVQQLVN